ncbi:unnamed protein product [Notodromas monacha]|uniref:beta-mannosidase n=1 Tax=Notodromas monacha TaxID=399045 RepID=A0A7R9BR68_9CRUS|nr:unnamed protein product [Notodromas monacha]CAG0919271.1 unnamed protein product [Notodromas monacha]
MGFPVHRCVVAVDLFAVLVVLLATTVCLAEYEMSGKFLRQDLGSDSGDWSVQNGDGSIQVAAVVPGGIYTDLQRGGIIGDPYYGFNDREYKWVGRSNWTYSRSFDVESEWMQKENVALVFEGLDTIATVFVNDQQVGSSDNMFVRHVFRIKPMLQVGANTLRVEFESPVLWAQKQAEDHVAQLGYGIVPACQAPEFQGECHMNMIRKMQASFAWDWGPSFPSVGIWKSVRLEAFSSCVIRDVKVSMTPVLPDEVESSDWTVQLRVHLEAATSEVMQSTLRWSMPELELEGTQQGSVTPSADFEVVMAANFNVSKEQGLKLWWPNGYGEQNLYTLEVTYLDGSSTEESSVQQMKIGFRTAELVQEPIPGAEGLTFEFVVNNVRMFSKGSNWIPADVLPERVTIDQLKHLLGAVRDTHQNMMRVWGGGIYESEDFYALADEMGIMIWRAIY